MGLFAFFIVRLLAAFCMLLISTNISRVGLHFNHLLLARDYSSLYGVLIIVVLTSICERQIFVPLQL